MAEGRGGVGSMERNGTNDNKTMWQLVKFAAVFTMGFLSFQRLGDAVTVYAIWKQLAILSVVAFVAFYLLVRLAERRYGFERRVSTARILLVLLLFTVATAGFEVFSNYIEKRWPAWALIGMSAVFVAIVLVLARRSGGESEQGE